MRQLPDDFIADLEATAAAYLTHSDPIRQSGFGGGAARWRAEREPILDGVAAAGTFIDVGCANGYLLECLVAWGVHRGLRLDPFGLDISAPLIERACARFPGREDHFYVGNAWSWQPPRRFDFVYSLYDCVPETYLEDYVRGLLARVVAPGGRLILGAYVREPHAESPRVRRRRVHAGVRVRRGGADAGGISSGGAVRVDRRAG